MGKTLIINLHGLAPYNYCSTPTPVNRATEHLTIRLTGVLSNNLARVTESIPVLVRYQKPTQLSGRWLRRHWRFR